MINQSALEFLKKRVDNTLITHLGIVFTDYVDGVLKATMPVDDRTRQVNDYLNGGATLALAESLAGSASALLLRNRSDVYNVGVQVSGNHVSSAHVGDVVEATCTLVHGGNSTHVWNVEVRSVQTGKLISTVNVLNFIKTKK